MPKIQFVPGNGIAPSDSPALYKLVDMTNYDLDVWEFADAVTENADFFLPALSDWVSGGTLRMYFTSPATTGNFRIQVGTRSIADSDAIDGALTNDTSDYAVDGTASDLIVVTQALTTTGWAADESLVVRITRLGGHANDTAADVVRLWGFVLEYS